MTTVVVTHAVGNMETWLAGGDSRKAVFANFCSGHRIFKHVDGKQVSIVCENADLAKMEATLRAPKTEAAKAKHSVIDPVEVYIEVEGRQVISGRDQPTTRCADIGQFQPRKHGCNLLRCHRHMHAVAFLAMRRQTSSGQCLPSPPEVFCTEILQGRHLLSDPTLVFPLAHQSAARMSSSITFRLKRYQATGAWWRSIAATMAFSRKPTWLYAKGIDLVHPVRLVREPFADLTFVDIQSRADVRQATPALAIRPTSLPDNSRTAPF